MRHVRENNNEAPNTKYHTKNTTIAIVRITGMKYETIVFANF